LRSTAEPAIEPAVWIGYAEPMSGIVHPCRSPLKSVAKTVTVESIMIEKAGVDE
jgi:hypothetical protein